MGNSRVQTFEVVDLTLLQKFISLAQQRFG
jgi:hypothetical protein